MYFLSAQVFNYLRSTQCIWSHDLWRTFRVFVALERLLSKCRQRWQLFVLIRRMSTLHGTKSARTDAGVSFISSLDLRVSRGQKEKYVGKKNGKERMGIRRKAKGERRRTERNVILFRSFSFNFLLHFRSMSNPSTSSRFLAPSSPSLKRKKISFMTEFRLFFGEEILFWENQENFLVLSANSFHSWDLFFFWRFRKTSRLILHFRHRRKITIMRNQYSIQFVVWLLDPWKTENSFSTIQFLIFFKTIYESVMNFSSNFTKSISQTIQWSAKRISLKSSIKCLSRRQNDIKYCQIRTDSHQETCRSKLVDDSFSVSAFQ